MNTLLAFGLGMLLICVLILLVVKLARDSSENRKRADYAERNIEIIQKFQQGMSRPLARGSDLVERMRSRVRKP